jgi:invasion protein IalB
VGCYSRVGFTAADVESFRRGQQAQIAIVPLVAPDQPVTVTLSLIGFSAGYDAVNASNAALAE